MHHLKVLLGLFAAVKEGSENAILSQIQVELGRHVGLLVVAEAELRCAAF